MRPHHRAAVSAGLVLAGVFALAACTSDPPGASSTPDDGSPPVTPTAPSVPLDAYSYGRSNVFATLRYTPGAGTLAITNKGETQLPAPDLYLLRAVNGQRVEATVERATPLLPGRTKTFTVRFVASLARQDVGILVLLIGADNYGAFQPPAAVS